jgi:hypothetical protein
VADLMAFDTPHLRSRRNSVLVRQNTCPLPCLPPTSRRHSFLRQRTAYIEPPLSTIKSPPGPQPLQPDSALKTFISDPPLHMNEPQENAPQPLTLEPADEAPHIPVELDLEANACASPSSDFNPRASNLSARASGHSNTTQAGSKRGTLGRSYSSTDAPSDDKVGACQGKVMFYRYIF